VATEERHDLIAQSELSYSIWLSPFIQVGFIFRVLQSAQWECGFKQLYLLLHEIHMRPIHVMIYFWLYGTIIVWGKVLHLLLELVKLMVDITTWTFIEHGKFCSCIRYNCHWNMGGCNSCNWSCTSHTPIKDHFPWVIIDSFHSWLLACLRQISLYFHWK